MSYRRKPRQYGLVLKCDAPGCTATFDTGQVSVRLAREYCSRSLGWHRMTSDAFGEPRKNDLCPPHAAHAIHRRQDRMAARKKRADDKAAGKKHVGTPPPGWAACERCGAHVLKRTDGVLRAHAPGLGRVTKRGQALCGESSPPAEPAQPGVSPRQFQQLGSMVTTIETGLAEVARAIDDLPENSFRRRFTDQRSIDMTKYKYQDTSSFQIGTKVRSIGYDVIGEVVEREPDSITIRWDWGQLGRFVGPEADRLEQVA